MALLTLSVLGLISLQAQEPQDTTIERDTSVVYQPMNQTLSVPENYNQGASSGERLVFEYFLDLNGDTINDFKFTSTLVIPLYTNWQNDNDYSISIHPLNNNRVIDFVSIHLNLIYFLRGLTKIQRFLYWVVSMIGLMVVELLLVLIGLGHLKVPIEMMKAFSVEPTYTGLEFNIEGQTYYGWMLMDFSQGKFESGSASS